MKRSLYMEYEGVGARVHIFNGLLTIQPDYTYSTDGYLDTGTEQERLQLLGFDFPTKMRIQLRLHID